MNKNKQLAAVLALTTLVGSSAFADSRHSNETRSRGERRDTIRRGRDGGRTEARRRDETRNESRERSRETYRDNSRNESRPRSDSRSRETYRNNHSDRNRQPYYARGRVSRVNPWRGGYHVYVHGARYPFFVPHSHYRRDRFRVGVVLHLGGYYNPAGYYDYYDGRSRGDLRGVVESVDYRRDTFVIRNDASGSFVTVVMNNRYGDNVRAGDYVEVSGDWTRSGVFRAYDVDRLD